MKQNLIIACIVVFLPLPATALEVFACEPEWASLVSEIAGDLANVTVATTAFQDPHSLQAKPSLIAAARSADLVVCTGADLEVGWLPLLLRRAANPRVQPGTTGHFLAADHVRRIEVPKSIDRSQGDVHPQGNPHVHLHPRNIGRIAVALTDALVAVDGGNDARYRTALADFIQRWDAAQVAWQERSQSLAELRLVSHHRSFSYLADWLDVDVVATLEPKPGIPASGAQLASLLETLSPSPPAGIIRAPFENEKPAHWLSDRLDVPVVELPYTVGYDATTPDLFGLYDETLRRLEEILP